VILESEEPGEEIELAHKVGGEKYDINENIILILPLLFYLSPPSLSYTIIHYLFLIG
jgi:hypothetical protein